jgi:energy-coupling factor transport system permease protein
MKITLGQYLPTDSPVHHLDPRIKFLLMCAGITVIFQIEGITSLLIFLLLCLGITRSAKIPFARLISGLSPFLWLFVFTAMLHVFMTPGDEVIWLPYATLQGVQNGIRVGLQLVCAIWISTLFTLTTSPMDMVWALKWFMKPLARLKVPVEDIALLVMLSIRFVPVVFEETDRIIKAQKARGIDLEKGFVKRLKALVAIVVPLLYSVFRRADDLAVALTLRGYAPGIKRTTMKIRHIRSVDVGVLAGALCIFATFIFF